MDHVRRRELKQLMGDGDDRPKGIRTAPHEAQVVAYEKGLIPYIPADRDKS